MARPSVRLTLCLGALLALQGCNVVIPSGLLSGIQTTGTTNTTKPSIKDDIGGPIVNNAGDLIGKDRDQGTSKPPIAPGEPPRPEPGVMPGYPGDVAIQPGFVGKRRPTCKEEFAALDADGNGSLAVEEFVRWPALGGDCGGGLIADNGGGLIAMNGDAKLVVGRDGSMIAANGDAMLVANRPAIAPAPCGQPHGDPKQLFMKADQDGTMDVDPGEFCQIYEALFGAPPPVDNTGCDGDLKRADQDGNGLVSLDEYMQADYHNPYMKSDMMAGPAVMPSKDELVARFMKYDLDQSGQLDAKEWCWAGGGEPNPPVMPEPPYPGDDRCDDGERDDNGDGLIDWGEYFTKRSETVKMTQEGYARFKEQAFAEFEKRDTNHDGFLDHAERNCTGGVKPVPAGTPCDAQFKTWDVDGDGYLSGDEYADGKWSEIRFIKAPTDEEAKRMRDAFYSEMKGHDRNGDGRLGREEFAATCQ